MSPPVIGITTYGRNPESRFTLPSEYVEAVRRAGGVPVLIAPGETRLASCLEFFDGLILAGGGDIDPRHYGGRPDGMLYGVDPERDRMELDLAREAVGRDVPTLAICRGAQVVNVALGGTLIEHLPAEIGESVAHRNDSLGPVPHAVSVKPDSFLARAIGATELFTPSLHHQAIRDVAPGLEIVARAPDGTIEAVELRSHRWLIAVQWHPELSAHEDAAQQRLFDALVDAAQARSRHEVVRPPGI